MFKRCSLETENTSHYLLHCHHNIPFCSNLTHNANTFVFDFELLSGNKNVEIILYGDSREMIIKIILYYQLL